MTPLLLPASWQPQNKLEDEQAWSRCIAGEERRVARLEVDMQELRELVQSNALTIAALTTICQNRADVESTRATGR